MLKNCLILHLIATSPFLFTLIFTLDKNRIFYEYKIS